MLGGSRLLVSSECACACVRWMSPPVGMNERVKAVDKDGFVLSCFSIEHVDFNH